VTVIEYDRRQASEEIKKALANVTNQLGEYGLLSVPSTLRDALITSLADMYWAGFSAGQKSVPE